MDNSSPNDLEKGKGNNWIRTYANKPGFDSKSLFLTHKYLRETGFAEFAWVSPVDITWKK